MASILSVSEKINKHQELVSHFNMSVYIDPEISEEKSISLM